VFAQRVVPRTAKLVSARYLFCLVPAPTYRATFESVTHSLPIFCDATAEFAVKVPGIKSSGGMAFMSLDIVAKTSTPVA